MVKRLFIIVVLSISLLSNSVALTPKEKSLLPPKVIEKHAELYSEELVYEIEVVEEEIEKYEETIVEEEIEKYEETIVEKDIAYYEEPAEETNDDNGMEYLGTFEITAYEWTGNPCASGNYPTLGYTVACNSLPLGTQVYIDTIGYRTVEDRGASWHSDNWMDLYLEDVGACYEFGRQYLDVYIVG